MTMSTNNGNIVGRLTRDPELTYTPSGTPMCKFGIAQDKRIPEKEPKPMFFNVIAWGKQAENIQKFFRKGQEIDLLFRLDYNTWVDKDTGTNRSAITLEIIHWGFVSGGKRDDEGDADRDDFAEEPPARQAPQRPAPQRPPTTQLRTQPPATAPTPQRREPVATAHVPARRPAPVATEPADDGEGDPWDDE